MNLKARDIKLILLFITYSIGLMWVLDNFGVVSNIFESIIIIILPFLVGGSIAFLFNIPMTIIEKILFGKYSPIKKINGGIKRVISYLITLIIVSYLIVIILTLIIPELALTIKDLTIKIPSYWKEVEFYIIKKLVDYPQLVDYFKAIDIDWISFEQNALEFIKNSAFSWITNTFSFASSIVGKIVSFVIAFIFSIYILMQKEQLSIQLKKITLAYLSPKNSNKLFYITNLTTKTFSNFISGQLLEAVIIAVMFLIAMVVFDFPYAILISLIIGITALIPMVGAFIGCGIGAFLILVDSPIKALWFIVMFIVIQQIEGNFIYPFVVGKAAGLPPIWILVAITLGGNLFGVLGIILFIPITSILYTLLRENVYIRLKNKKIKNVKLDMKD